ncbi:hypothetical protein INT45_008260 [Circinella minor]|uniref:RING-type E3 ubiquitin transferase n=1 Tax=Circinella minor TaxID=1195481 RepID=A0A8H7VQ94_9FUNG|nr:hypothetical protein INT45_008260 [Circinella minor]
MGKRKRLGTIITKTENFDNNCNNTISNCTDSKSSSNNSSNCNSNKGSCTSTTSTGSNSNNKDDNNNNNNNNNNSSTIIKPTCSICIQPYIRRTFLQPCYHSFCFTCIRQWINIAPNCPLCKQAIDSLIYNMDETTNTFQEYVLHDHDHHNPSPELPPTSLQDRILPLRRQIYYTQYKNVIYPPVANRFAHVQYITPVHIPKKKKEEGGYDDWCVQVSTFLTREVPAIMGKASDSFTERHIKAILLTPYEANKQHNKPTTTTTASNSSKSFSFSPSSFSSSSSSSPVSFTSNNSNNTAKNNQQQQQRQQRMSMYDSNVIQELGEWLTIGTKDLDGDNVARKFIDEIMAFIKSGMDYWTFVATVIYEE